jgi:hypothetical protein
LLCRMLEGTRSVSVAVFSSIKSFPGMTLDSFVIFSRSFFRNISMTEEILGYEIPRDFQMFAYSPES